jgi:hypothetical protein
MPNLRDADDAAFVNRIQSHAEVLKPKTLEFKKLSTRPKRRAFDPKFSVSSPQAGRRRVQSPNVKCSPKRDSAG